MLTDTQRAQACVDAFKPLTMGLLPGEGETKIIVKTRVRICCDSCGELADQKHTYLLPNPRRNPQSNAYGKDDCSWCSDEETFSCEQCRKDYFYGREPKVDGYEWCSTFFAEKMPHMFLRWKEDEIQNLPSNKSNNTAATR